MGKINDIKSKLTEIYETPSVKKAFDAYNTWRNTKSNLFSKDAQNLILNNSLIPDVIKEKYTGINGAVQAATYGLAGASVTTAALRYQKPINAVITAGVRTVHDASEFVNDKIDDAVESYRSKRGYESIIKEDNEDSKSAELFA